MSDIDPSESFSVALGGRSWVLPHLTFGVVKRLQPRVLKINAALTSSEAAFVGLDEAALDEMLGVTLIALQVVEPGLTRAALEALIFSTSDLIVAQIPILRALGLARSESPSAEGSADPKAPSTIS